jgi:MFS family permease
MLPIRLVLMLSIGLMINYVDRGSISVAAPLLEKALQLSPAEMGWVLSAFFWAYVPFQPIMGWLADRIGAARVLAAGFALWSIATFLTGLSTGVVSLVALRLVMGVGESAFYPCAVSLLANRVKDRHRTRATSAVTLGGVVGPAVGTLIGGLMMTRFGWQTMFIGLGAVSLIWLIPWLGQLRQERSTEAARARISGPSFAAILSQRALWGAMLGVFCSNYAFYFVFTCLPLYLVQDRGLSLIDMTHLTTWIYLVDGASVLATGWLLDAWIKRGACFDRAYKTTLIVSGVGVGACLLACTGVGMSAAVFVLLLLGFMDGLNSPTTPAVTQKFAGPDASGRWMGLQNAVANLSGVAAPVVTGYLVQATGHYTAALIVAGTVALVGACTWAFVVPTVKTVDWARQGSAQYAG